MAGCRTVLRLLRGRRDVCVFTFIVPTGTRALTTSGLGSVAFLSGASSDVEHTLSDEKYWPVYACDMLYTQSHEGREYSNLQTVERLERSTWSWT